MKRSKCNTLPVVLLLLAAGLIGALLVSAGATEGVNPFIGTAWSLVPPLVAIVLALLTKEVYSSLFVGIVTGTLLAQDFQFMAATDSLLQDGLIAAVSDTAGIFVFLVILGALVALINQTGASAAFGRWAERHIHTRTGAMLATFALGVLIFIDDYFNCLTVGSIMSPITDRKQISRAKLAYLIDATAAPICMIAPISSWAAAVSEYTSDVTTASGETISSLALFCRAIPYNFYSLLTFVFILALIAMKFDYGPMKQCEQDAMAGDLHLLREKSRSDTTSDTATDNVADNVAIHSPHTTAASSDTASHSASASTQVRLADLLLPILALILLVVLALIYVGGFFDPSSAYTGDFVGAFGNTDATLALPMGSLGALILTMLYLMARRLISFGDALECVSKGFTSMVPAILILTMATSLKNMTGLLASDVFVGNALAGAGALYSFLPAVFFLIACGIAFATGTSWGTFGILIPIVLTVFPAGSELMIIGMSACLAGAVCGDHCSPISDTTIMSSAGAQCDHVEHVTTQLPYAMTVAAVSFVTYLLAGFVQSWYVALPAGAAMMVGTLFVLKKWAH